MVRQFFFILIFLLILTSISRTQSVFSEQLIFPLQDKHVHSSSLVECPNGDLLACWFHGSGERQANDVQIQGARLKKGKAEWSSPFQMADTPGLPDCNPVLFMDVRNRLWLFWVAVQANRWEHSILKYRISANYQKDGAPVWDWQDIILLQPGEGFVKTIKEGFEQIQTETVWAEYALPYEKMIIEAAADSRKNQTGWMTRTHLLTLKSGRILLPLYSDGFNISLVAMSDDTGKTWQASLPIVGYGNSQPAIVQKKDGTLLAYMRDDGNPPNRVPISISKDQGYTWSTATDTEIPNPGSSLQILALKEGGWLLVCNDTEEGRHRLAVMLSEDEGQTWKYKKYPGNSVDKTSTFAYPSIIQTRDGFIHVTCSYTENRREAIRHLLFKKEWLIQD
jgi:predicted neuraminidase